MTHEFSNEEVASMRDALELFDGGRSAGDAIIPFNQVANFARSFGWNPLDSTVAVLLGGGDEENPATKQDMQTKCISFEDLLPILWAISTGPDPGNFDDFMEAMRVFDKDGNGTMSGAEMRHVMCGLGEKMTTAEIDILIDGMEDMHGLVKYEDFIKKLMCDDQSYETDR